MVGGVGLPNYFFLLSFFLSGQVMVLVSLGFVLGMSPRGGPRAGLGWARWFFFWVTIALTGAPAYRNEKGLPILTMK